MTSKGNQRKKNHLDQSYGRGDTTETVSEGLAEVEIRFPDGESALQAIAGENKLSATESAFQAGDNGSTPSISEDVLRLKKRGKRLPVVETYSANTRRARGLSHLQAG